MQCPCQSGQLFADCCERFIYEKAYPETPEQLMRSRYTAYSLHNLDYITRTMRGVAQKQFDRESTTKLPKWIRLEVLASSVRNEKGWVEFKAYYKEDGKEYCLYELSEFSKYKGRWYYINGIINPTKTSTVGRNESCSCGSGKKYKKCCMR